MAKEESNNQFKTGNSYFDDNEISNFPMYRDSPEWADVTPVPQNDGKNSVVRIAYSEEFTDVYDYFRAVVKNGELSERVLGLTEDAIQLNAANYTVWQYRRKVLKALNSDLKEELVFCRVMIEQNPKNYQVWHHRRVIVEWLNDPSRELRLTEIIFNLDAKNYHAWEHRQWVLKQFSLFQNELNYVEQLIEDDVRNNSAWNQRYFVVNCTTGFTDEVINREIDYAKMAIDKLPNNESPWSYLKGILIHSNKSLREHESLITWCHEKVSTKGDCPHLLSFIIDILTDQAEVSNNEEKKKDQIKKAVVICDRLATEHDTIRKEYWTYRARKLCSTLGS